MKKRPYFCSYLGINCEKFVAIGIESVTHRPLERKRERDRERKKKNQTVECKLKTREVFQKTRKKKLTQISSSHSDEIM